MSSVRYVYKQPKNKHENSATQNGKMFPVSFGQNTTSLSARLREFHSEEDGKEYRKKREAKKLS